MLEFLASGKEYPIVKTLHPLLATGLSLAFPCQPRNLKLSISLTLTPHFLSLSNLDVTRFHCSAETILLDRGGRHTDIKLRVVSPTILCTQNTSLLSPSQDIWEIWREADGCGRVLRNYFIMLLFNLKLIGIDFAKPSFCAGLLWDTRLTDTVALMRSLDDCQSTFFFQSSLSASAGRSLQCKESTHLNPESKPLLFPGGSGLSLDSHSDMWPTWGNLQPPLIQGELVSKKLGACWHLFPQGSGLKIQAN